MSPASTAEETVVLPITGMSCAACSTYLERTLAELPGVSAVSVSLLANQATVTGTVPPAGLIAAVQQAGYEASLPEISDPQRAMQDGAHLALRALLALAAAAVSMTLSMGLMGAGRMTPLPAPVARWTLLALALAVMTVLSPETYQRAWAAARHRTTNMSTLVAIGTLAALAWSAVATAAPALLVRHGVEPTVYFEAIDFILAFLLVGAWLDARARRRTQSALEAFANLAPSSARVRRDGVESTIATDQVLPGDLVLLRPGERIPVDGVVTDGTSTVDESLLTGEPMPLLKTAESRVSAGTIVLDGPLTVRATTVGAASTLAQLRRLLATAQSSRAPMQQLADRASAIFVPIVLLLAALTFLVWIAMSHAPAQAVSAAVAVLVIACPCAMGLAVPAALTVGIGRAAQAGVLVKSGEALERLARVRTLAFDKTGTLTEGQPRILTASYAPDLPPDQQRPALELAAALEDGSEHPLARAVEAFVHPVGSPQPQLVLTDRKTIPGQGVTAVYNGQPVALGNTRLTGIAGEGTDTELHLMQNGRLLVSLTAADSLRASARDAVAQLSSLGITAQMLTGDVAAAALRIAEALGIPAPDTHAGLLPADKLALIHTLQRQAPTAMAGDGLNDAAALAAADTGIAVSGAGTGTDLAREAADIVLLHPDLTRIPLVIRLARRTTRTMRQNLGWALGYNIIGLPVAAGVLYPHFHILLSPVLASAAMALSSTSVLLNSLRLRRFH